MLLRSKFLSIFLSIFGLVWPRSSMLMLFIQSIVAIATILTDVRASLIVFVSLIVVLAVKFRPWYT